MYGRNIINGAIELGSVLFRYEKRMLDFLELERDYVNVGFNAGGTWGRFPKIFLELR